MGWLLDGPHLQAISISTDNQHVVGHSIERRLFATHFQVAVSLLETFPGLPAAVPVLNTLAN